MTEAVVHVLEPVEIDEHDADDEPVATVPCERERSSVSEERTVRQAGEGIVERLVNEVALKLLAVGDVVHHPQHTVGLAGVGRRFGGRERCGAVEVARLKRSVDADMGVLRLALSPHRSVRRQNPLQLRRREQRCQWTADRRGAGPAEQTLRRSVRPGDCFIAVHDEHRALGILDEHGRSVRGPVRTLSSADQTGGKNERCACRQPTRHSHARSSSRARLGSRTQRECRVEERRAKGRSAGGTLECLLELTGEHLVERRVDHTVVVGERSGEVGDDG